MVLFPSEKNAAGGAAGWRGAAAGGPQRGAAPGLRGGGSPPLLPCQLPTQNQPRGPFLVPPSRTAMPLPIPYMLSPPSPLPFPTAAGGVHSWRAESMERPYGHPHPGHTVPQYDKQRSGHTRVWGFPGRPQHSPHSTTPSPPISPLYWPPCWVFSAGSKQRLALYPAPHWLSFPVPPKPRKGPFWLPAHGFPREALPLSDALCSGFLPHLSAKMTL